MSFVYARGKAVDRIFERMGEAATWSGISGTVMIRWGEEDEVVGADDPGLVMATHRVRVRRSEVSEPAPGDVVCPLESGGTYIVTGSPRIDRKGIWLCELLAQ